MKKIIINCVFIFFTTLIVGCKSIPQEAFDSKDYLNQYFASTDEDCSFIFEFINQSNKPLKLEAFIDEPKNLNNQYYPKITSSIFIAEAGQCLTFKINADKLIKDFSREYVIGINCFEKNWHWWQEIVKSMKNKRSRIVVKNDSFEGGQFYNRPYKNQTKFEINEFSVEYEKRRYMSYLITETPEEYNSVFDTRIFYRNSSNNSSRLSNIYTLSCKERIQELLDKGEFLVVYNEGYKILLIEDPLDLNKYFAKENDSYDFIYEIVNNSSDKIIAANIVLDEKSQMLGLSNDLEIEPGKSYQIKYNLDTLKKIYGEKAQLGLDVKKAKESQWIRGWINSLEYKNDKHTVVVSDGTNDRVIDVFDLWTEFPEELKKGIMIY